VEFGCGLGYVTRWATSVGADALGIDLSADQIAQATELAEGKTEFVSEACTTTACSGELRRVVLALGSCT
jgi:cyclopropane fatty-acyl-phospholipid synthase-like methyltransferase